jgi:signal transduction histidine kinase
MIKKLSLNLALTYAMIFIIAITVIDVLLILSYRKIQFDKTENFYTGVAEFLSSKVETNIKVSNLISNSGNMQVRILYLDNEGTVLADSMNQLESRKITNVEIRNVLGNMTSSIGYYTYNDRNIAMFASPVLSKNEMFGIILISAYVDEVYQEISNFTNAIILISATVLIAVIILSVLMGERIIKPIKELTKASHEILKGNMGVVADIKRKDEIGVLATTFNLMSKELHKLETSRKRFLSDVSHELKTPLASIKALIDSLIYGGETDIETIKEFLLDINSEIDRMSSLVKSLLTSERLEEIQLKVTSVCLYDEIESILKIFTPSAQKMNIKLLNNSDRHFSVNLDREMFHEVLINLVDNGIKYGKNDGLLTIETQCHNDRISLVVKDNGIGISKKDLPFIFDNFYRVDEARTKDTSGNGIGLFVVKRICELHGFDISVKSEPDKGTEFKLTF